MGEYADYQIDSEIDRMSGFGPRWMGPTVRLTPAELKVLSLEHKINEQHGVIKMLGNTDTETILLGCYYPGCENDHAFNHKFCFHHGGRPTSNAEREKAKMDAPKKSTKKAAPKKSTKKAAPKKSTKKAAPKKSTKKAAPKKSTKVLSPQAKAAGKRTNKGTGNGTAAQKAAAIKSQGFDRIDWATEIANFKKGKRSEMATEMGSAGSAQVTRSRVLKLPVSKGLTITTRGAEIIFAKGGAK